MLSKYKIGVKMGAGFGIVLLLTVIIAAVSFTSMRSINAKTDEALGSRFEQLNMARDAQYAAMGELANARGFVLYGQDKFMKAYEEHFQTANDSMKKLDGLLDDANDKQLLAEMQKANSEYGRLFMEEVIPKYKRGDDSWKEIAATTMAETQASFAEKCDTMASTQMKKMTEDAKSVEAAASRAIALTLTMAIISILMGIGAAVAVSRSIIQPTTRLVAAANEIAKGDLTVEIDVQGNDEVAQLGMAFSTMVDGLRAVVGNIMETSQKLTASSEELSATAQEVGKASQSIAETINQVAAGSTEQSKTVTGASNSMEQLQQAIQEVSKGAQSQAKTVEETVGLIQQISQAIESVAGTAQMASTASLEVADVAKSGGDSVGKSVEGMARIKETSANVAEAVVQLGENSKQIGAIVETIDDIAEQTNLLALNAAIEAARAGEHGKGFAVVADEVRKLAERSSKATKEIADLIGNIQQMTDHAVAAMQAGTQEVETGTELAAQAGEALESILKAVNGIVGQIEDVSAATQQMSASSTEVAKAVESLSAVTEESSAATEEMAASSSEVTTAVEQVAAVSEENAASAEEVAAAAEEQNASVEEMAASADELAKVAQELQSLVTRFKIDDGRSASSYRVVEGLQRNRETRKAA